MTQLQQIIKYLQPPGRTITPMQALNKFDCWALSSRVSDMKKMGIKIRSELVTRKGKTFAKYSIL